MSKSTTELGELTAVELTKAWPNEPQDFTPWLRDNIAKLGDAIGMDLEVEGTEVSVGKFSADLLCQEGGTGQRVVIENQYNKTDHDHLGKMLTYAAGLEASTVVWVAERFQDEHVAAIDWLNRVTDEKTNFFGIEIKLFRIGDSPFAPMFDVVSKPNAWSRSLTKAANLEAAASPAKQLQLAYWGELHAFMKAKKGPVKPTKPQPQHWMDFNPFNHGNFKLTAVVDTQKDEFRISLVVKNDADKAIFSQLFAKKADLEAKLGLPLEWEELEGRKESRVTLKVPNYKPSAKEGWAKSQEWVAQHLDKMHHTFFQAVKSLASTETPEGPES